MDKKIPIFLMFYNNFNWTKVCLDRLRKNTPEKLYELILINNGSTDFYAEKIIGLINKEDKVVSFNNEVGTSFAYNYAIEKYAKDSKFFITLHNDVIVTKNWLKELLCCADKLEKGDFCFSCISPRTNYCFVGTPVKHDEEIRDKFLANKMPNKDFCSSRDINGVLYSTYYTEGNEKDGDGYKGLEEYAINSSGGLKGKYSISDEINSFCTMFNTEIFFKFGEFDKDFISPGYECHLFNFNTTNKNVYPVLSLGSYVHHNGNTTADGVGKNVKESSEEGLSLFEDKIQLAKEKIKKEIILNTKIRSGKIKCLMIRDNGIGDIIMSLFIMKGLKKEFDNIEITVATKPDLMDFVSFFDCVDFVIPLKDNKFISSEEIDAVTEMYSNKFDIVFNLIEMFEKINREEKMHRIEQVKNFVINSEIGKYAKNIKEICPSLEISTSFSNKTLRKIPESKLITIGMAPYGTCPIRTIPEETVKKIVLLESESKQVIIFGEEKTALNLELNKNVIDLRGEYKLEELPVLIAKCRYLYTSDSGPFHIAGLLGIPCRAFFGSIDPVLRDGFYPSSEKNIIYYKDDLVCTPCFDAGCDEVECMKYSNDEMERIVIGEKLINVG